MALLLMLCMSGAATAQFIPGQGDDSIQVTPNIAPYRTILKLAMLSPLEQKKAIRMGVEITINKLFTLQPEIGLIYGPPLNNEKLNTRYVNTEERLGFRYYMPENVFNGLYTGPLFTMATVSYRTGTLRNYYPNQPDSAFLDFSNAAQYQQTDFGMYWIAGLQPVISRHFNFDIGGGIGLVMEQITTKYDPYYGTKQSLPAVANSNKILGYISLSLGYIF